VCAPADSVYAALRSTDFGTSLLLRLLFALRGLPARLVNRSSAPKLSGCITLDNLIAAGFGIVAEDAGRELVLGVGGRFWRPAPDAQPITRADELARPGVGYAHAGWNFTVRALGDGTALLSTETRIVTGDPASRRRFRAYWLLVRPFSGIVRRVMLRAIRREAESSTGR
jgi:hypothetical protein